ncbi:MAG: hypothetical protein D6806_10015 [Deltaproteobacteria bacterium]|nr:MAG: hypothetical protein D6806_10015 [Deltaproteobacteria bacterium]
MTVFEGIRAEELEVFAPSKWSSHAFNRQRLELKLKLAALGKQFLEGPLKRLALENMLADERPSIFNGHRADHLAWFGFRTGSEKNLVESFQRTGVKTGTREPYQAELHIHFFAGLDKAGMSCGIRLARTARVDIENASKLAAETGFAESLAGIAESAGASAYIAQDSTSLSELPSSTIADALERLEKSQCDALFIGRMLDASSMEEMGEHLPDELSAVISSLLPAYQKLAWSRGNDKLGLVSKSKHRAVQAAARLQEGDEVRVLSGLASGRVGVVEQLLKRGQVAVRLGNLVMNFPAESLEVVSSRAKRKNT